ncbi:hypothetical protein HF876_13560 [Psychrobacillus sp. BL-248-WT-3]|nr:hypothetical protein [Psychrobacillus sp. BL-248-WT-3]
MNLMILLQKNISKHEKWFEVKTNYCNRKPMVAAKPQAYFIFHEIV